MSNWAIQVRVSHACRTGTLFLISFFKTYEFFLKLGTIDLFNVPFYRNFKKVSIYETGAGSHTPPISRALTPVCHTCPLPESTDKGHKRRVVQGEPSRYYRKKTKNYEPKLKALRTGEKIMTDIWLGDYPTYQIAADVFRIAAFYISGGIVLPMTSFHGVRRHSHPFHLISLARRKHHEFENKLKQLLLKCYSTICTSHGSVFVLEHGHHVLGASANQPQSVNALIVAQELEFTDRIQSTLQELHERGWDWKMQPCFEGHTLPELTASNHSAFQELHKQGWKMTIEPPCRVSSQVTISTLPRPTLISGPKILETCETTLNSIGSGISRSNVREK